MSRALYSDYLRRSVGVGALADGAAWLLDAALEDPAEQVASRPSFHIECSVRLTTQGVQRARYILCWPSTEIGVRALQRAEWALSARVITPRAKRWIQALMNAGHMPSLVIAGLAWSSLASEHVVRLHLEQRSLTAVLASGRPPRDPAVCSLEWKLDEPAHAVRRDYFEHAIPRKEELSVWLEAMMGSVPPAGLARALSEMLEQVSPRYAYAQINAGDSSSAPAVQVVHAPVPAMPLLPTIERLAGVLGLEMTSAADVFADVPEAQLCAVTLGMDRRAGAHLTLYHRPTRLSSTGPASSR